jgi:hypothetical protein
MNKQQQSARDAAIDTRKLINALTERLEAVKEGLAEEDASPTRNQAVVAYCDGQIYQIEYLLSDINFGCYDAAKGESVTVKAEPPDLKSILLEIVCNYPEAIEQIKAMENVTAAHYGLAYGVTPALFVSHGYDGVQDRVRLQEKPQQPDPAVKGEPPVSGCIAKRSLEWLETDLEHFRFAYSMGDLSGSDFGIIETWAEFIKGIKL